ncbi:MAG TPA: flagellar hook-basal body complex protein FliE [Clostridiaceae bacterium]|nr:flagellar hook-basal body complex protein FliE [Clostridiaceae bacterium]
MAINSITQLKPLSLSQHSIVTNDRNDAAVSFIDYLNSALEKTNNLIIESEKLAEDFAAGRTDNIHQVLIAAEKADIAFQFTVQIRNKILDAYNEIMRMQI